MVSSSLIIKVQGLYAQYPGPNGPLPVLHNINFSMQLGESIGIIGETGSGKTTLARCLMGLLPWSDVEGSIQLAGQELVGLDETRLQRIRWQRIAMAFQGTGGGFDPVYTIGQQIMEPMQIHLGLSKAAAAEKTRNLLAHVELPASRFDFYPHQLSGGEKQRAMIAMALACDPEVLIVDEPTTGLDVMTQTRMLGLLADLKAERALTLIVISHNLTDISRLADRTMVLYGGQIMEVAPTIELMNNPQHPYSWGLLNAYPTMTTSKDLWGIRGSPPEPGAIISGCPFHPRCTQAIDDCATEIPPLVNISDNGRSLACLRGGLVTLLQVNGISKTFSQPSGALFGRKKNRVRAVDQVDLSIRAGEVVAVVGQSGSGKTTLARLILRLVEPDQGEIIFDGKKLTELGGDALRGVQRQIQIIFQEPMEAVSPRLTVGEIIREPLDIQKIGRPEDRDREVSAALQAVNLPDNPAFRNRYVYQLSGGQAQRVVIARALILSPRLIIADEPVSMLDASEQAKVLNLLKRLQNERGIALLLISHDLALVRKIADRILVMYAGRIVEQGPSHQIISAPKQAPTRALIEASPRLLVELAD